MTRRELVQMALRHQETERLPYHLEFTGQAQKRFEEYMQDPDRLPCAADQRQPIRTENAAAMLLCRTVLSRPHWRSIRGM